MIEFYTWFTPNGRKVAILLEELGIEYNTHSVNIGKDEQFDPEFLKISPNNKIPAIVDTDNNNYPLFETGAILLYLAEKHGKFLNTSDRDAYWRTMEWLMWQMGGIGPMLGQAHHFNFYAREKVEYAMTRYSNEANRLYGVLDRRLEGRDYVADEFSIADIAIFPWTRTYERQNVEIEDYPNVVQWRQRMFQRPAVQRGMKVGAEWRADLRDLSAEEWNKLFGA